MCEQGGPGAQALIEKGGCVGTGLSGRDKEVDGPGRQAHGGDPVLEPGAQ